MFDSEQSSARIDSQSRANQVGATSLIRNGVYDNVGERLGEIEELILDTRTGCVRYVVLTSKGFLGFGRKRFAIPWSAVAPDLDYRRCVVNVAQMSLMAVQVSDDDPWLQRTHLRAFAVPRNRFPVVSPE